MGKTLTTYVNEAVKGNDIRLVDMEEIVYPDGKVIKIADVEEKFHTSCMYIFSAYSFFAPAVKALTPIITNEIDTMATDGIRIFMNPRFTAELTDTQCIFVILHECMHNILNHLTREKQNGFSDHQRANIAADYEVNGILENDGIVKAGTTKTLGGFIDPKYNGWAFERIYNDPSMNKGGSSPKQQGNPQSGQGQPGQGQPADGSGLDSGSGPGLGSGSGPGSGGSQSSGASKEARKSEVSQLGGSFIDKDLGEKIAKESGYDPDELGTDENLETKWSKIAQQVAAGATAHGSGRGSGLLGIINSIYKPSKNWKAELKKFVGHAVGGLKTANTWGRKSYLQYDDIRRYDRKENECLDQVVFMIDTSGSTHGDILMKLLSETHHIIEQKKIANVTYAYYGDGLVGTEVIKKPKDINPEKLKVRNGGGTNIGRSLDEMGQYMHDRKKGGHKAELLMIFTDGDLYNNYTEKPKWCKNAMFVICDCPGCPEPSWGKALYIDASDVK